MATSLSLQGQPALLSWRRPPGELVKGVQPDAGMISWRTWARLLEPTRPDCGGITASGSGKPELWPEEEKRCPPAPCLRSWRRSSGMLLLIGILLTLSCGSSAQAAAANHV